MDYMEIYVDLLSMGYDADVDDGTGSGSTTGASGFSDVLLPLVQFSCWHWKWKWSFRLQ